MKRRFVWYGVRGNGVLDAGNVQDADGVDRVIDGLVSLKAECHLTLSLHCV